MLGNRLRVSRPREISGCSSVNGQRLLQIVPSEFIMIISSVIHSV